MNKIKTFLLAAVLMMGASNINAQGQKSAYISVEQMVSLMPELGRIDTLLQRYQADSINTAFADLVRDYNYRDSILKRPDTASMPPSVKRQHEQEREGAAYQIQNWQQISQQALQAKQQELLGPVYQRVMDAVSTLR